MMVLVETETPNVSLNAETLTELGPTSEPRTSLVRDERTVGTVLEGWASVGQVAVSAASLHHLKEE
jgi:hypothetical protein